MFSNDYGPGDDYPDLPPQQGYSRSPNLFPVITSYLLSKTHSKPHKQAGVKPPAGFQLEVENHLNILRIKF
jgi:hypothetical protein